ncbi:putative protein-like [Raphanus sativus]|nr:putative protein-like [Raphanus sativus]
MSKNGESTRLEDVKAKAVGNGRPQRRAEDDELSMILDTARPPWKYLSIIWGDTLDVYGERRFSHNGCLRRIGEKRRTLWPSTSGFLYSTERLAFEAITSTGLEVTEPPREIDSIVPTLNDDEERGFLADVWERDETTTSLILLWTAGFSVSMKDNTVFFEDMYEEDMEARKATAAAQAVLEDVAPFEEVAEQKKMLEDLVKLVKSWK